MKERKNERKTETKKDRKKENKRKKERKNERKKEGFFFYGHRRLRSFCPLKSIILLGRLAVP